LREDGSLVMLPGMAADERLFEPQRRVFPRLLVPPWIEPLPCELLPAYAGRMARLVEPSGPSLVGGASFGGLVALEMAVHLGLSSCVLIASVRTPSEMPWRLRALRPLAWLGPGRLGSAAGWASRWSAPALRPGNARRLGRLGATTPRSGFLRWACWAALRWRPSPATRRVRVWQIHGSADRTFPLRSARPDVIVRGGGHLLPLTHPGEVNAFLQRAAAGIA
jgi:pimeloyl-ACP methyl ester carboxylesterase